MPLRRSMGSQITGKDQSSRPVTIRPDQHRGRSPIPRSTPRATSIARLASPVPSSVLADNGFRPSQSVRSQAAIPDHSALANAFQGSVSHNPPRFGTSPLRSQSPAISTLDRRRRTPPTVYGSVDSEHGLLRRADDNGDVRENPNIVRKHLVTSTTAKADSAQNGDKRLSDFDDEEFSSLKLQGGDVTREVYRWAEGNGLQSSSIRGKRSKSWHSSHPEPDENRVDVASIRIPGGFRRDHIRRAAPQDEHARIPNSHLEENDNEGQRQERTFVSRNFLEFLTIYGHFAGEELEEEDDIDYFQAKPQDQAGYMDVSDTDGEDDALETSALLTPRALGRRRRRVKERGAPGTSTPMGAALLLLKSFVGTGVLFLPRAYSNGGMLFSNLVLLAVAILSYYCFVLLVQSRLKVPGSFGDIGGILYGQWMRALILFSVTLSQIGFVSAYIVFTSENLQAFVMAVSKANTWIDIKYMVLMQLIIFLPLSLIRDITKLGATALIADFFILLGLVYLAAFDVKTIVANHGVADIISFNSDKWTLFIGTAVFTFEGVGLIIPIQESMIQPARFPPVLAGVMIIITILFIGIGALSYAAFGSLTKTVVLLNLPQDSKMVNTVQCLYSLAILLSTPLQLFPAIRIMESSLFSRSGKNDTCVKWWKNVFRFFVVILCALIAWGGAGDLDKFVSLVGSFACVPLVYVYPAMLHYRAVATTRTMKIADIVLCCFGILVMVYTTSMTVHSWAATAPEPLR